jgi:hypothetical protein
VRRRSLAIASLALGWLIGFVLYRRTARARRDRVDLYFDDGSMLSLENGSDGLERLLPLARETLRAARGT